MIGKASGNSIDTLVARFDDLKVGSALEFRGPLKIISTHSLNGVDAAVREVDHASQAGKWAVGYVSYEAASGLDARLKTVQGSGDAAPLVWFAIVGPPKAVAPVNNIGNEGAYDCAPWVPDFDARTHGRALAAVRRAIGDGETYQCNLTTILRSTVTGDLFAMYADMASNQGGSFNAFVRSGHQMVLSASPERFFEWRGDEILSSPMKGTSPRGRSASDDIVARSTLTSSAKDAAENIMIVDLIRNDLVQLGVVGGVSVGEMLRCEAYKTVWQLTSDVYVKTLPRLTLTDIFRAMFPCGSITGAPKQRTMELICELEPSPRGVYCGAIGWVAPSTHSGVRARFGVAIRTAVVNTDTGEATYGAGGGITWDSKAESEYSELLAKARVLTGRRLGSARLLETMSSSGAGYIRNLAGHLKRLQFSADRFSVPINLDSIKEMLKDATRPQAPALVRLTVGQRGDADVKLAELPRPRVGPVPIAIDWEPIQSSDVFVCHKTTMRERYDVRRTRHPGADDILLINEKGNITESAIANVAVRLGGRWYTPPLADGCIPGVERERLLRLRFLTERSIHHRELICADAIALVSSVRGWRLATLVEGETGPVPD